jgi:hypothetical protein
MNAMTSDATSLLLRSLRVKFGLSEGLVFEEIRSRAWASATFSGARHELVLRLDGYNAGAVADRLLLGLDAAEFTLRGHILADIALVQREALAGGVQRLRLEALTVEDA